MTDETNLRGSAAGDVGAPVVVERKGGKRRYSSGLRNVQVSERHFSRALHRVARSFEKAIDTYEGAREESSLRSRDGAIVDFIPNVAEGLSSMLETLTPLPNDLAQALYPSRARRIVRNATRVVGDVFDSRDDDDDDDDWDDDDDDDDD